MTQNNNPSWVLFAKIRLGSTILVLAHGGLDSTEIDRLRGEHAELLSEIKEAKIPKQDLSEEAQHLWNAAELMLAYLESGISTSYDEAFKEWKLANSAGQTQAVRQQINSKEEEI